MKRLTPKKEYRKDIVFSKDWQTNEICKKYCELEDYEDELGVDLEIKLKVETYYMRNYKDLKATVVVKGRDGKLITVSLYHFFPTAVSVLYPGDEYCCGQLLYKDYSETWALTKEELENEKDCHEEVR